MFPTASAATYSFVSDFITSLTNRTHQQVQVKALNRTVNPYVSQYSLGSCFDLIDLAISFERESVKNQQLLDFKLLQSTTLAPFSKDAWGGKPSVIQKVQKPRKKQSSKKTALSHTIEPSLSKGLPLKSLTNLPAGRTLKTNHNNQFIKLPEVFQEDSISQNLRQLKIKEQQMNMDTIGINQRQQDRSSNVKSLGLCNFTYDYNGCRINYKEQLQRKGIAPLPNIQYRQVYQQNVKLNKQLQDRKFTLFRNSECNVNQPVCPLNLQKIKQYVEDIKLQEGVRLEDFQEGHFKGRTLKTINKIRCQDRITPRGSEGGSCQLPDILGLSRIQYKQISYVPKPVSQLHDEISVSDKWKNDVHVEFQANRASITKLNPDMDTVVSNIEEQKSPTNNYDMTILASPQWGHSRPFLSRKKAFFSKPTSLHRKTPDLNRSYRTRNVNTAVKALKSKPT